MKKNYIQTIRKTLKVILLLMLNSYVSAQIPLNAANADPSTTSVTQVPVGNDIAGSALINFKFTNEALTVDSTGQIPAGAVRLTITFPATSAFSSASSIPKFHIESNDQPNGVVTLINDSIILEKEVLDLLINVKGTATGSGTITYIVSLALPETSRNLQINNETTLATFNTSMVLPVNLKSFDASINNCDNNINWQSASEDNLKNYLLEYSYDGNTYIGFYEVNAKGNNSLYNTNHTPTKGKVFYRLKMIDFDGKYEYSKIIPLNIICNKSWAVVYPNPTTQIINVNISTLNKLPTTVVLYDAVGKKILSQLLQNGTNKIDVSKIALGIYTVTFSENTGIKNSSIIIK